MVNLYIDKSAFPYVPTLKRDNPFEKTDCRPISILLTLSSLWTILIRPNTLSLEQYIMKNTMLL